MIHILLKSKKLLLRLIMVLAIANLVLLNIAAPQAARAIDEPKFRTFVTEPLGTEKMVYRITQCNYAPVMVPVRCPQQADKCVAEVGTADKCKKYCYYNQDESVPANYKPGAVVKKCPGDPAASTCEPEKEIIDTKEDFKVNPSEANKKIYKATLTNCREFKVVDAINGSGTEAQVGSFTSGENLKKATKTAPTGYGALNNECIVPPVKQEWEDAPSGEPYFKCELLGVVEGDSGSDLLMFYIRAIYRWAAGLVGIIAVLVIAISGIQITAAAGDSAKVDAAKTRIMESLAGLVLLFLSGLFLYTINPDFFVTDSAPAATTAPPAAPAP